MNRVALIALPLLIALAGCRSWEGDWAEPYVEGAEGLPNPYPVPALSCDLVMDVVADELDDYFRLARQERPRVVEPVLTEGWIETHPRIGSTLLEPWHRDSQPGYEKLHATLQTVRRCAKVRIVPSEDQYWIDVQVYKELEDLPQPVGSTVRGSLPRHDNSIGGEEFDLPEPVNRGWIPLGRDLELEQVILQNIQQRMESAAMGG